MIGIVVSVCLILSVLNWILFLYLALLQNKKVTAAPPSLSTTQVHAMNPSELVDKAGSLAKAFKEAGAAPTAAAMSMVYLLIAVIAIGIDKI